MRILLNKFKRDNYNYIDYEQYVFLDLTNFLGYAKTLTKTLRKSLECGKVIDLDNSFKEVVIQDKVKIINDKALEYFKVVYNIEPKIEEVPLPPLESGEVGSEETIKEVLEDKENDKKVQTKKEKKVKEKK